MSELAFIGIGATGLVGGALTRERLITQTLKIGMSFGSRPKVDLATLVDDQNLVEEVVDTFSGLIEGDEGGLTKDISHDPQALDEIQGGTSIQATSGVIPGLNSSTCGHHIDDGHSLTFTTTDTVNEHITKEHLCRPGNVEHAEKEVANFIDVRLSLNAWETPFGTRNLSSQGKIRCLGAC